MSFIQQQMIVLITNLLTAGARPMQYCVNPIYAEISNP